jgi:hypothetical protein
VTQFNQYLLRNYNFSEWGSPTAPSVWQQTAVVATTLSRLREHDPKTDPKRAVFTRGPYVFDGGSSLRATMTAAHAAGDFVLRQGNATAAGVAVQPLDLIAIAFALRCSVNGNLARGRVIGLLGTTDTLFLEPVGNADAIALNYNQMGQRFTWNTTARDIAFTMHDGWQVFGVVAEVPMGIDSVSVRIGSGSAGAQVMDIGAVHFRELERKKVT